MSLHKFADMVAKQGRGEDSLLIHMTPDEVQRLQQFAEANGRSLTINPETGLPEAGMLSDLFKAVAPIALGAFLGPAGVAFGGPGLSAAMAGVATGGLTTLATGSLSRGLMAGLGAYGGAGLGESLMGAGTGGLAATDIAAQQAAGSFPTLAEGATQEQIAKYGADVSALRDAAVKKAGEASFMSKASAGFGAIADNPAAYGKDLFKYGSAAAAPIMAAQMVPTTTKMPENTNPAYIRQKLYDPYTQTYKSLEPVKASEWGSRSFSDAYTNPQTGIAATLDNRKPTPMAGGGIVALANGGGIDQILADAARLRAATASTAPTQAVAIPGVVDTTKPGQYVTDPATGNAVALSAYSPGFDPNNKVAQTYLGELAAKGGTDTTSQMFNQMGASQAQQGANAAAWATEKARLDAIDAANAAKQPTGLATLANIPSDASYTNRFFAERGLGFDPIDRSIDSFLDTYRTKLAGMTPKEQEDALRNALQTERMNEADVIKATGKNIAQLIQYKGASVVPGGYYGNATTGNVMTTTPGDITTNFDGTATVIPNISGRPDGGFTGMGQVRDVYTAGGGSLGYTSPAPKTIAEFNQLYNKQTGDSLAAYDYLMGKGAGTANAAKYPIQSVAAATGINRPYWGDGMRYKQKFLSYGKDGEIKSSTTSGKTADAKAADLTKAKTIEVTDSSGETNQTYTAVLQDDGTYLAGNGKRYDVSGKEVAANGGMISYAMGGGLGSLGSYSDGGRLLKGPGDGVSDSIPATIGAKKQPARLADGEFVVPARIVSELGNGSTEAGARKLYAMMDRVQKARGKTTGKNKVAANTRADKHLPA